MEEQQRHSILSTLAYAVQRGISAEHLCRISGVDFEKLKRGKAPQNFREQVRHQGDSNGPTYQTL